MTTHIITLLWFAFWITFLWYKMKFHRLKCRIGSWNPICEVSSEKRAWDLLEELLSPEQKVRVLIWGSLIERGKYGYYIIPVSSRSSIRFFPKYNRPLRFLSLLYKLHKTEEKYLVGKLIWIKDICLSLTGFSPIEEDAPWYDAVATFVLHIRAGNELELFKRGNVY